MSRSHDGAADDGPAAIEITFQPMGVTVEVPRGETLFRAAADVGVEVDTVCGGNGLCGKCKVLVTDESSVAAKPIDHVHLNGDEIRDGYRLSCQIEANEDLVVSVPPAGARNVKILHHGVQREVPLRPNVLKIHLPFVPPRSRDGIADWDAVKAVLPSWFTRVQVPLHWLRRLPALIRDETGMTLTIVRRRTVTRIEPGDTTIDSCGIAVDVGSTSIVGYLLDLNTGEELAVASGLNRQAAYGDDIIGRLSRAQFDESGLLRLHELLIDQLDDVFDELLSAAGADKSVVTEVTVVGNMAMHHFLLRLDSTYLGLSPYAPVTRDSVVVSADTLGLHLEPDVPVYVLPNIAGFVGSDTVGVILASGISTARTPTMAVDVGTNGEVVIGSRDGMVACSAPAGPAFEGARIKHGMRATTGAIDHVSMNGDVDFSVIGDTAPVGICGSALIDIAAGMLRSGLLDHTGKLLLHRELPDSVPGALRDRLVDGETRKDSYFVLVREGEGEALSEIVFTQQDIREFQLAKGAIRAGQMVLQQQVGIEDDDLGEVVLAGAFGTYIDLKNARLVNLVPPIEMGRLRSVGNAAGVGAKLALLSTRQRSLAERIGAGTEHIRLSGLDEFQKAFTHAMRFPHINPTGGN